MLVRFSINDASRGFRASDNCFLKAFNSLETMFIRLSGMGFESSRRDGEGSS